MRFRPLLPFLLALVAGTSYGLTPPPGASGLQALLSSASSASEQSITNQTGSPSFNPAVGAVQSLPEFDLFCAGILAPSATNVYAGTGISVDGSLPSPYGVYSAGGRFVSTGSSLGLGTFGALRFSFAKALYPTLLVGAGAGLQLGMGSQFDWGLGLDLGFVSLPGTVGILKDLRWGVAIDGIGKPYRPFPAYSGMPPSLTPSVNAGFQVYQGRNLSIRLDSAVSFPSFQDVRMGIGGDFSLGKSTSIRLGTSIDVGDLLSHSQAVPLSAGISFVIKPKSLSTKISRIQPTVAVEPVAPGTYAFGGGVQATVGSVNTQPPHVSERVPRVSYISPNGDGVKDSLVVPIKITDQSPIVGYELTIRSASAKVVRTLHSPSLAISASGSTAIFDRLLYAKGGVPIPRALEWDGTSSTGKVVPDGSYTFTVSAWNKYGNRTTTDPDTVIVSTRPPTIHLTQPEGTPPIFSPNGDGYKDTLPIRQSGSKEPIWIGQFLDSAGKIVRTITWTDSVPKSFKWNGRGNGGKVLPDGVYSYRISSTDRAGNSVSASVPTIIIDTSRPSVEVTVNGDAISPGTSSPLQMVKYGFTVPQRNDIASWKFDITDSNGTVVRSTEGGSAMPHGYSFDGSDKQGNSLPDGNYHARLSVIYRNGSHATARAASVTIDRTAPSATVGEDYHVFAPIGSGSRTTISFSVSASKQGVWKGRIATGGGKAVKSYVWHGSPPAKVSWNGRGRNGKIEPDGAYQFYVYSTDEAGNYGQSNVVSFALDTQHKQLFLSTNHRAFSPNGARDVIRITPNVRSSKGFESYRIEITSHSGKTVGSFRGTGVPNGSFAWNGLTTGGKPVPAGRYRAVMQASYATGATVTAQTPWFTVVTTLPTLSISANYHLFSPNGDGHRDSVTFSQSATGGSIWVGRIVSSSGKTILEKQWESKLPPIFVWHGTDRLGNVAGNGTYTYQLSARDAAGNVAQTQVGGIVLDNRPTQVYIDSGAAGFSPNGDGIKDQIAITTLEKPDTGISSWRISVLDSSGSIEKEWTGNGGPPPSRLEWNGSSRTGETPPDGDYQARLTVHYVKGDVDTSVSSPFLLVARSPKVTVHLSPLPFPSPEAGTSSGQNRLSIRISVESLDPIARWRMQIYTPPIEEPFYALTGTGKPPALLFWDGKSATGKSMIPNSVYSYHLTVVDSLGNRTLVTGNIRVGGTKSGGVPGAQSRTSTQPGSSGKSPPSSQ